MASNQENEGDKFVYPWMGIIANVPRWKEKGTGRYVGRSGSNLRAELTHQGFNPVRVNPQWNHAGFSGFAVVEFTKDWSGFENALALEKMFDGNQHGKVHYKGSRNVGDGLYGWVAREDDYRSTEVFASVLQKKGDLKSIDDILKDEQNRLSSLVSTVTQELDEKSQSIKTFESKVNETAEAVNKMMMQNENLHRMYEEELKKMQEADSSQLKGIFSNHEVALSRLEIERRKLMAREVELRRREALNKQEMEKLAQQKEREKLDLQKELNEKATEEQKIANQKLMKMTTGHKREKEALHARIIEMRRALDAREVLELEIESLRGTIEVTKHMGDEGEEGREMLLQIQNDLKEKEEELESITETNQALIIKERNTNDELQDARKELIKNLNDTTSSRKVVGVKRMGDVDVAPFREALRGRMSNKRKADLKATELCSQWSEELRNPHWHPYKMVKIADSEDYEEMVNPDDEKLSKLKRELGDVAYEAVATALRELNEYNRSGRYPVLELWNFKNNKKATLQEGCSYAIELLKLNKLRK